MRSEVIGRALSAKLAVKVICYSYSASLGALTMPDPALILSPRRTSPAPSGSGHHEGDERPLASTTKTTTVFDGARARAPE
jgi:hypothetical protein